eukprot:11123070-Karenia_brevis.AAC.1
MQPFAKGIVRGKLLTRPEACRRKTWHGEHHFEAKPWNKRSDAILGLRDGLLFPNDVLRKLNNMTLY